MKTQDIKLYLGLSVPSKIIYRLTDNIPKGILTE